MCCRQCCWIAVRLQIKYPVLHCRNNSKIQFQNCRKIHPNTQIHDNSLTCPGRACTSIISGGIKLFLWSQTSPLSEMVWSCKWFPLWHYVTRDNYKEKVNHNGVWVEKGSEDPWSLVGLGETCGAKFNYIKQLLYTINEQTSSNSIDSENSSKRMIFNFHKFVFNILTRNILIVYFP